MSLEREVKRRQLKDLRSQRLPAPLPDPVGDLVLAYAIREQGRQIAKTMLFARYEQGRR